MDEGHCRGYGKVLGLYICWENGELRWFDPVNEAYLRTFTEEIARAEQAEGEHERAQTERDRETEARRQAEAENRRLRERLQVLGETE